MDNSIELQIIDMYNSKPIHIKLKSLWLELCEPLEIPAIVIAKEFNELIEHYDGKGRFYHTSNHIYYMLNKFDLLKSDCLDEVSLLFSIWYHDLIYHSKAKDNEERSAEIAVEKLTNFGLKSLTIQQVNSLILTTKKHYPIVDIPDSKILLDLDLSILGVPPEDYQTYKDNIRKEYAWVPGFLYKKNRKKILLNFLERERLYFTETMFEKYEHQARENIKKEIVELK